MNTQILRRKQIKAVVIALLFWMTLGVHAWANSPVASEALPEVKFTITKLNLNVLSINESGRTVALVSPQGFIDWLLISPDDKGRRITQIYIESHMSHILGFKMILFFPRLAPDVKNITSEIFDNGTKVRLVGDISYENGLWRSRHEAVLSLNAETRRFEWAFQSDVTCTAKEPVKCPQGLLEYNNVYPSLTGLCMLYADRAEYNHILISDKNGDIWNFPLFHRAPGRYINTLTLAEGSMAGFFGEERNPVVILEKSTLVPHWSICTMYYDIHCNGVCPDPVKPGTGHHFTYKVKYLDAKESAALDNKAREFPKNEDDYRNGIPRLALGNNDFTQPVSMDSHDDGNYFPPSPPVMVWDKQAGPKGKGALIITNKTDKETPWFSAPPNPIPVGTRLRVNALVKTQDVEGKGVFIRFRPHRYHWGQMPGYDYAIPLESKSVNGTKDWVRVTTPVLETTEHSWFVWIGFVLDGKGSALISDVNVELEYIEGMTDPVLIK